MKCLTASEIFSSATCDNTLVKVPELVPGKDKILYNGKPPRFLIKGEKGVIGSSSNSMFDYCPSVKLKKDQRENLLNLSRTW